jgi:hypothetical protein
VSSTPCIDMSGLQHADKQRCHRNAHQVLTTAVVGLLCCAVLCCAPSGEFVPAENHWSFSNSQARQTEPGQEPGVSDEAGA